MEEAHFFLATVCFDSRQLQKPQLKIRRGNCPLKKLRDQIDQSLELDHRLKGVLIPQMTSICYMLWYSGEQSKIVGLLLH